jgi:hypothetical protein
VLLIEMEVEHECNEEHDWREGGGVCC